MFGLIYASVLLVVADAIAAPFAVRRSNRGDVPSEGTQRAWALAAVVGAYVVALAIGR